MKTLIKISDSDFGLSFKDFCKLAKTEGIISNWVEVLSDLETPVSIYSKLHKHSPDAFLLESVEGGEKLGRYSIIGFRAIKTIMTNNVDCYEELSKEIKKYEQKVNQDKLPFFHKGYVGYLSFETIKYIEPSLKDSVKQARFPEMYMLLTGSMAVFDHVKHKLYLISNILIDQEDISEDALKPLYEKSIDEIHELKEIINENANLKSIQIDDELESKVDFKSNTGKEKFMDMVKTAKNHILEGDIFQVVLSHILSADLSLDPLLLYRILRAVNPSPYLFLLNARDNNDEYFSLVGSSPEMLVKSHRENNDHDKAPAFKAELRPIAGTYKRGNTIEEDKELSDKLLNDPKERAEHVMLVDLARNDLGRVCENNTIEVPENMKIEKYSHVLHIVSSVIGKLKASENATSLIKACFPAGTLSGAPKIKALEIINNLEKEYRGPYGGCLGYFSLNNALDTAMIIRTLVVEKNKVHIQAGAGVVADSIPENEYQETLNKAGAMMKVVNIASSLG